MRILGAREGRENGPCISKNSWHEVMLKEDFTGIDLAIEDMDQHGMTTLMVSQARTINSSRLVKIISDKNNPSNRVSDLFRKVSSSPYFEVTHGTWSSDFTDKDAIHVVVDSRRRSLLVAPEQEEFARVIKLLRQCSRIFWLSVSDEEGEILDPESNLVVGLARTAHAENENLSLVTLSVHEQVRRGCAALQQKILKLIEILGHCRYPQEREYVWKDGHMLIPRLITAQINPQRVEYSKCSYHGHDRPLKLDLKHTHRADAPIFVDEIFRKKKLRSMKSKLELELMLLTDGLQCHAVKAVTKVILGRFLAS